MSIKLNNKEILSVICNKINIIIIIIVTTNV